MLSLVTIVLLVAQQFVPGQVLRATCDGRWANLATAETVIGADCAALPAPPPPATAIVIDHGVVNDEAFAAVPLAPIQALRVMSVDRSVGWNIAQGIQCLATETAESRAYCQRWSWPDGSYAVEPMTWAAHPLPGWQYFTWPGFSVPDGTPQLPCPDPYGYIPCFESYVDAHAGEWDVFSMQPSYLDAGTELAASDYLAMYERLRARHPTKTIVLHTASLARTIGTAANAEFNATVRGYVAVNGGVLIDVADIETFDPYNQPWFYDGYPAISPYYTSEQSGGHLGSPSAGMIRLAQAWWIALARILGY
jgi:hypothetical protein